MQKLKKKSQAAGALPSWYYQIPEGATVVTHPKRLKGWIGYIAEIPWGLPEVADVQWVYGPPQQACHSIRYKDGKPTIPAGTVRYPIQDLQEVGFEELEKVAIASRNDVFEE